MLGISTGIIAGFLLGLVDVTYFAGASVPGHSDLAGLARIVCLWILLGSLVGFAIVSIKNRSMDIRGLTVAGAIAVASFVPFLITGGMQSSQVSVWKSARSDFETINVGASPVSAPLELLTIGIDGATWDVIDPLIAAGRLPNIAALTARGASGVLRSEEPTASPVVWTTLFTGKAPAEHGISDWDVALSQHRKVKPLWTILEDNDVRTVVANVPGTYPADGSCDAMLAGFPFPSWTRNRKGWLVSAGDQDGSVLRHVPLQLDAAGKGTLELHDLPAAAPSENSLFFRTLRLFDESLAESLERAMFEKVYLELVIATDSSGDGGEKVDSVHLYSGGVDTPDGDRAGYPHDEASAAIAPIEQPLLTLRQGAWSVPLLVEDEGKWLWTAAYLVDAAPAELRILFTPLTPLDDPGLMHNAVQALPAERGPVMIPYTPEMLGWNTFFERAALGPLSESFPLLVDSRGAYFDALLRERSAAAGVIVFTATDRAQHGFWKFRDPQFYWNVDDQVYNEVAPSAREVDMYGSVIDHAYEAVDRRIGDLLESTDADTLVVLLSDHGFRSGRHELSPGAGVHDTKGIYVMARGGRRGAVEAREVAARGEATELGLLDVLPTVLASMGLPVARDLQGTLRRDVLDSVASPAWLATTGKELRTLASYESPAGRGSDGAGHGIDSTMQEQLRSLGYLQ